MALAQVLTSRDGGSSGSGTLRYKIQGLLWAPADVRKTFKRIFDRVRNAFEAQGRGLEAGDAEAGQVHYSHQSEGLHLAHFDGSTYKSIYCSDGDIKLSLKLGKLPLPVPDGYVAEKGITEARGHVHISTTTKRRNGQITREDCRTIEHVFESACRVMEREDPAQLGE